MTLLKTSLFVGFEDEINKFMDSQNGHDIKFYTWDQFRSYILNFSWIFHFSTVENSTLKVYSLRSFKYPLLIQFVLFWITNQHPTIVDHKGLSLRVTLKTLAVSAKMMLFALFSIRALIRSVLSDLSRLSVNIGSQKKVLDDNNQVVIYCRTDLWFGLKSGGSIGHISGVLNNLRYFYGRPVFITTDVIPTVSENIPTYLLEVDQRFADFSELPSLACNKIFLSQALHEIGDSKPAFIYQRYSLNSYLGAQLSEFYDAPFVLEYNGSEVWIARHWGLPLKYEAISKKIENINLNSADVVVVVSRPMKDELVSRNIDAKKILVNPNGVDPARYSPKVDGNKLRKMYGLEDKLVIGFIGTFGRWHGAEVLAEAFVQLLQRLPERKTDLHLMMIGDGLTLPQVKAIIAKHGLSDNCTFSGTVPQIEGPSYLAVCDILASPHIPNPDGTPFFGSPTKLFEYMAMGKAIVASDLDQIGEVLSHKHTAWMVKPGNADELAAGLAQLICDPSLRDLLGRAARAEVIAKYTWEEHTRRIIEKLKECCGV